MAAIEPAWEAFQRELQDHLRRPVHDADGRLIAAKTTSQALADRLGDPVTFETVNNWRRGVTHPRLRQLPRIAEALDMGGQSAGQYDPLYLLRCMEMLDPEPETGELIDRAYRLQKLELKLFAAQESAATLGRQRGAAEIVRAAALTGEWAVAVWPAIEGPPDCRMHVADRIDLRRCDGVPVGPDDVWRVPELKTALRAAYAVPSSRVPRWPSGDDTGASSWAVSHIGSPMSPLVAAAHPGLISLAFTSLTVDSWVNDVASLTATGIGYGLTTTRDLAMEHTGLSAGVTRAEDRRATHERLLDRPPSRRVWSHHAPLADSRHDPFTPLNTPWRQDVVHIRLRESDDLLEDAAARRGWPDGEVAHLKSDRETIDAQIQQLPNPDQVINIDVDLYADPNLRWLQVLECVKETLDQLTSRSFLPPSLHDLHGQIASKDVTVAKPVIDWLRQRACLAM